MNYSPRNVKNFYSFVAILLFMILAAGSARVNKIHCGAFSTTPSGEDMMADSYVLLRDGTKVHGEGISWKSGALVRDQIKIGDKTFKINETQGYFKDGIYYAQLGSDYAKRIIHGKINIYFTQNLSTTTSTDAQGRMRTSTRTVCTHYAQRGEGSIFPIANQDDIIALVKDCPASVAMVDKKDKEIRKSIRKNRNYLNDVIITYNNGCQ